VTSFITIKSLLTFRKNILLPASESKNKPRSLLPSRFYPSLLSSAVGCSRLLQNTGKLPTYTASHLGIISMIIFFVNGYRYFSITIIKCRYTLVTLQKPEKIREYSD
jgi:hypothetical protein